jgi:hypothetical protein
MKTLTLTRITCSLMMILVAVTIFGCPSASNGPNGTDGDDDTIDGGRIPRCLAEDGLDLFAAEGDEVLGITWNNLAESDSEGGYRVRYGTSVDEVDELSDEMLSPCTDFECELNLTGLENNVVYSLEVQSLNVDGETTHVSCTIEATPHPLAFLADVRVHADTSGMQDCPDVVVGAEGAPLLLAWEDGGAIRLGRSDDLGDTWSDPFTVGSGVDQAHPA